MQRDALKRGRLRLRIRSRAAGSVLFLLAAGVLGALHPRASCAHDDRGFLVEYRQHLARLREATENIECDFRCLRTDQRGKHEEIVGTMRAKGEARQIVQDDASPSAGSSEHSLVLSAAPSIRFHLRRAESGAPYQIASLDNTAGGQRGAQINTGISMNVEPFINAAFQIFDVSIPNALDDPDTEFEVTKLDRGGHELYELALNFPKSQNKRTAQAVLDPSLDLAVREFEITFNLRSGKGTKFVRKGWVEYQQMQDGAVVPKSIRMETALPDTDKENVRVTTVDFVKVVRGDVSDNQFRLSAFGLPDISGTPKRRFYPLDRWYFWTLVAAAIAGWLYLKKRRPRYQDITQARA